MRQAAAAVRAAQLDQALREASAKLLRLTHDKRAVPSITHKRSAWAGALEASLRLRGQHWATALAAHLTASDAAARETREVAKQLDAAAAELATLETTTAAALAEQGDGVPLALQLKDVRDRVRRLQRVHDEKAAQMRQAERELAAADAQLQDQRRANADALSRLDELVAEQAARNAQCAERCTALERQLRQAAV